MSSELSELDQLIESDVLEALGEKVTEDSSAEIDGITIEDISDEESSNEFDIQKEEQSKEIATEDPKQEVKQEDNLQAMASSDLASLLSELLNNKTIEITIKVKD